MSGKFEHRAVNQVPLKDRDIAMAFQNCVLYPHMSVYDNLPFGLKLRRTDKEDIDSPGAPWRRRSRIPGVAASASARSM